MLGNIGRE